MWRCGAKAEEARSVARRRADKAAMKKEESAPVGRQCRAGGLGAGCITR